MGYHGILWELDGNIDGHTMGYWWAYSGMLSDTDGICIKFSYSSCELRYYTLRPSYINIFKMWMFHIKGWYP